jgi:hypothetical protein
MSILLVQLTDQFNNRILFTGSNCLNQLSILENCKKGQQTTACIWERTVCNCRTSQRNT